MSHQAETIALVRSVVAQVLSEHGNRIAYTIDQAAEAVGLPRNTLRDCVSSGQLRAVKRCGRWMITRTDLLRWLSDAPE